MTANQANPLNLGEFHLLTLRFLRDLRVFAVTPGSFTKDAPVGPVTTVFPQSPSFEFFRNCFSNFIGLQRT